METRKTDTRGTNRSGLTLVEAVIALSLFSICIGGVCRLLVTVREGSDMARDHYAAANMGKNRIERARAFEFGQLHLIVEPGTVTDDNGSPDITGRFRRTTTISEAQPGLFEISVTIDIRNRKTLAFEGEQEVIRSYFADIPVEVN